MNTYKENNEPQELIGMQCTKPYPCEYWEHCTKNLPKPNVFDIYGGMHTDKKFEKYYEGKISFKDLQYENLNPKYLEQIDFEINNKEPKIEKEPSFGISICYEIIFPHQIINPQDKPDWLINLTNDGWYGVSAGPYQHLAAAQMRAVEEGVTVIRSANTGISAVIAPNGDMSGVIGLNQKGIADAVLPRVLARETVYGTYGNVVPGGLILLCWLVMWLFRYRKYNLKL